MRRCLVRAMYLSASEVAVSVLGALYKCSTFTFFLPLAGLTLKTDAALLGRKQALLAFGTYFDDDELTSFVRPSNVDQLHNIRIASLQQPQPIVNLHGDQKHVRLLHA